MNILVTGANGFVGRNLVAHLRQRRPDDTLFLYDKDNTQEELNRFSHEADFVFHLAGINRPTDVSEFETGNKLFTENILTRLAKKPPFVLSSSIQAALQNPYGISKRAAEDAVFAYYELTGSSVYVFRLANLFGKWCRPNYNSVVATFCNNVANDLPIEIHDPAASLSLSYIDDVCNAFLRTIDDVTLKSGMYCTVSETYNISLGELAPKITSFRESRANLQIPDMADLLTKKLYSTYLSYLPENEFSYPLKSSADSRGSFTEFIHTENSGQVSVNITKPGITKGNHWHHTKNEKFLVVSGNAVIRFRKIGSDVVVEYPVCGETPTVVDIPTGYTHSITNIGSADLVTVMWANEIFNADIPDTFFEEVIK